MSTQPAHINGAFPKIPNDGEYYISSQNQEGGRPGDLGSSRSSEPTVNQLENNCIHRPQHLHPSQLPTLHVEDPDADSIEPDTQQTTATYSPHSRRYNHRPTRQQVANDDDILGHRHEGDRAPSTMTPRTDVDLFPERHPSTMVRPEERAAGRGAYAARMAYHMPAQHGGAGGTIRRRAFDHSGEVFPEDHRADHNRYLDPPHQPLEMYDVARDTVKRMKPLA
jgi:hypothetical protein